MCQQTSAKFLSWRVLPHGPWRILVASKVQPQLPSEEWICLGNPGICRSAGAQLHNMVLCFCADVEALVSGVRYVRIRWDGHHGLWR